MLFCVSVLVLFVRLLNKDERVMVLCCIFVFMCVLKAEFITCSRCPLFLWVGHAMSLRRILRARRQDTLPDWSRHGHGPQSGQPTQRNDPCLMARPCISAVLQKRSLPGGKTLQQCRTILAWWQNLTTMPYDPCLMAKPYNNAVLKKRPLPDGKTLQQCRPKETILAWWQNLTTKPSLPHDLKKRQCRSKEGLTTMPI